MNNKLFVDIHVLETVPPSCINRDDTGSPKTAVYGGTVRARVSSQCWKKAMRSMFTETLPEELLGKRTKMVYNLLTDAIRQRNPALKAEKLAEDVLKTAGLSLKDDKGTQKTGALFFISLGQINALANLAVRNAFGKFDKKECQAALKDNPSVDVALFGRMVADDPSLNYDAAAQVAHAISTHTVHNEYDYFTAVDDCAPEDNAGAGHLGTVEYNSSTLYRYAAIDVEELIRHLGKDTIAAVRAFTQAFILSMPTGKQNTFANNVLPDAVYVALRHDRPISLVGAFETPVRTKNGGYVEESIHAFILHAKQVYHDYLGEPDDAFAIGDELNELAQTMPLNALLERLESAVSNFGGFA